MTWGTISKSVDIEKAADPEATFKGLPEGTITTTRSVREHRTR